MISAMPSQVVNQKKEVSRSPVDEDYTKSTSISGALNINRYYLVLIGKALELFGAVRIFQCCNSIAYYDQQIKYLEYVYDTMSAKISNEECNAIEKLLSDINELKGGVFIKDYTGNASMMKVNKATDLNSKIRLLYRTILATLENHHMLTFKDVNPGELLGEFGE